MHIHDESTARHLRRRVLVNWSRELTFSDRQVDYIRANVPDERGVYCVYAKDYSFQYESPGWQTKRWSRVVYIGSGWLHRRLADHLVYKKNDVLEDYLANQALGYRYDRIFDDDSEQDWPRIVEAALLHLFKEKFGNLPPANRRRESIPPLDIHTFTVTEPEYVSVVARG